MHKYIEKKKVDLSTLKNHQIETIIDFIKNNCSSKFDEKIDLVYKLNMDPKKESVRGSVVLTHGIKPIKPIKVGIFSNESLATEENIIILNENDIEEIKNGKPIDLDICLTTQKFFAKLVPIAKKLSSMGLMPNNKEGTVVSNPMETAKQIQLGKQSKFRHDSAGYIHISVGRQSQDTNEIISNIKEITHMINSFKNAKKKGNFIESVIINSTMGKYSIKLTLKDIL